MGSIWFFSGVFLLIYFMYLLIIRWEKFCVYFLRENGGFQLIGALFVQSCA